MTRQRVTSKKNLKNPILIQFAKKVKMRRCELGLTQEELAERAHMHVNYIGAIERAVRNVSLKKIVDLARALELSPKELMLD